MSHFSFPLPSLQPPTLEDLSMASSRFDESVFLAKMEGEAEQRMASIRFDMQGMIPIGVSNLESSQEYEVEAEVEEEEEEEVDQTGEEESEDDDFSQGTGTT